jgi:iron complex outermembrane receptor protein
MTQVLFLQTGSRLLAILSLLLSAGSFLFAQDASTPSKSSPELLPPIIVTAKIPSGSQCFQNFDAQDIQDTNVQTAPDLLQQVPNVSVNSHDSFPGTTYTVRGVGENTLLLSNDLRSSVAQYIDDIPSLDTLSRQTPLFNIASAQFYRGPQETYFGAPSPAGALNIYTVAPTNFWSGTIDYQYGSYDFQQVQATVNAPLIKDQLYLGFAGNFSEQDGYITNSIDNSKVNGDQKRNGLLRLIWTPNSKLEIGLYGGLGNLSQSNYYDDLPVSQLPNQYTLPTNFNGYNYQRYNTQALRVVWNGDGYRLLSVTSRQAQNLSDLYNASYVVKALPLNIEDAGETFKTETYTQEFRAESQDNSSPLQWRGGLFFNHRAQSGDDENLIYNLPLITGMPGTAEAHVLNNVTESDYALYGQATYHATDRLDLTAGMRGEIFDEDSDSGLGLTGIAGAILGGGFHAGTRPASLTQGTYLPTVQATYHWTDEQFSWAKVDKAWRPGGVGLYQIAPSGYTKETSWNFEIGHKISLLDDHFSITPTLFYSLYQNYQAPFVVTPIIIYETNAKYASARGAELTLTYTPVSRLNFSSNLGYTEARYDEYSGGVNGSAVPNIPEYTVDNDIDWRYPLTKETNFMLRMDYNIVGDFNALSTSHGSSYKQGAYGLLSAKVGYEFSHGGVYLFGANLSDSHYNESIEYDPTLGFIGNPGAPATLGVELSLNF